jgi:PsbP-like protein
LYRYYKYLYFYYCYNLLLSYSNSGKKIQEYSTKEISNYKNANLGISIQYPSSWIKNESESQVTFSPSSDNSTYSSITIQSIPSLGASLEEKISESVNYSKQNLASFHIIGYNASTLAGTQSYNLWYSYTDRQSGIHYKVMTIYAIKQGKEYSISHIEKSDRYSSYLPIIQRMVDSLRIQGTDNGTDRLVDSSIGSGNRPTGIAVNPKTNMIYVLYCAPTQSFYNMLRRLVAGIL